VIPSIVMFVVSMMLLVPGLARAAEHLHGVVLSITPKTGDVIVRHDPFGSMPAMTMPFRIIPAARAAQIQAGATIDADVNTATEPWTLSHVISRSAQPLVTDTSPFRRVTPLKVGDIVPDTPFVDQLGRPFRFSDLRGHDVVLSFVYTRCRDARMCPLISAKFRELETLTAKRNVRLVEVTLDPAYDRPPVLARYGQAFGADPSRWKLVVGDADPTLDFAARFGISAFPDPQIGIIHSENTVLVDRDGRIASMMTDTAWIPDDVVAQLDTMSGIASNPLARLNLWLSATATAICGNSVAGFSGLTDLIVVIAILSALTYLTYRLVRTIFFTSV
jgi:cytochrome oxidase Cu insertion factor (SCO1/SenC/PrrC family)/Cu/Ag efflux protein CusF